MGNSMPGWMVAAPLTTARVVDLTRFAGPGDVGASALDIERKGKTWFAIAFLPYPFQPTDSKYVTAFYSWNPVSRAMLVINSHYVGDNHQYIEGVATLDPSAEAGSKSKLLLKFVPNPTQPVVWPGSAKYWILFVDEKNYRYAAVCGGTRDTLWILSATRTMSDEDFDLIIERLKSEFGYTQEALDSLILPPCVPEEKIQN